MPKKRQLVKLVNGGIHTHNKIIWAIKNNAKYKYRNIWKAVGDFPLMNENILEAIIWSTTTFKV